jgi:hypothetical protein
MADMDAAAKESSLASWRTVDNWEDRVRDPLKVSLCMCAGRCDQRHALLHCCGIQT